MNRVLCISPGHSPSRSSRQPWAYIEGIAREFQRRGHTTKIIGDGPLSADNSISIDVPFEHVDSVRNISDIETVADRFGPDVCLWSIGATTSVYSGTSLPRIAERQLAITPGPLYSPKEIATQLSPKDLPQIPSYASLIASSLVPIRWFQHFLGRNFDSIVAPTETILDSLTGYSSEIDGFLVQHGRDCGILASTPGETQFRKETPLPPDKPYVLNFGPPRSIRGATDYLNAVLELRESGHDVTGVMLARIDNVSDRSRLENIERRFIERAQKKAFLIIDRYLTHAELVRYIKGASAVALPYRIVQSTVPISILEALGLGKPVITTNVHGARELVPTEDWTVPPKNESAIASGLGQLLGSKEISDGKLTNHLPTWKESVQPLTDTLQGERE